MNALHGNQHTRQALARLDLAIERAELVQALGRIDDRIYALKRSNGPAAAIELQERAARSLQKRLQVLRKKSRD